MQKFIYQTIWVLIFLSVNICALPISIYSLFIMERGTNITNWDYALAVLILITSNFITFQLFFAIHRLQKQNALLGISVGIIQLISFILFMHLYEITAVFLFSLAIIAALILLVRTWKNKHPAL